jgi:hypothetical protein
MSHPETYSAKYVNNVHGYVDGIFGWIDRQAMCKYMDREIRAWLRANGFVLSVYETDFVTWLGNSGQLTFRDGRLIKRCKL